MTVLTKNDFNEKVLESNGITFVEFYASWCPHCQAFMPEWFKIAEELEQEANFYQVEVDRSPELTQEYNVEGYPTIIVFNNGEEVTSFEGAQPITVFEEVINDLS